MLQEIKQAHTSMLHGIHKYHNPITDQYAIKDGKFWLTTVKVWPRKETHRYQNPRTLLDLWFLPINTKYQALLNTKKEMDAFNIKHTN